MYAITAEWPDGRRSPVHLGKDGAEPAAPRERALAGRHDATIFTRREDAETALRFLEGMQETAPAGKKEDEFRSGTLRVSRTNLASPAEANVIAVLPADRGPGSGQRVRYVRLGREGKPVLVDEAGDATRFGDARSARAGIELVERQLPCERQGPGRNAERSEALAVRGYAQRDEE